MKSDNILLKLFYGLLIWYVKAFSRSNYILCSFLRPPNALRFFAEYKIVIRLKTAYHVKLKCLDLKGDLELKH